MKKRILIFIILTLLFSLAACSNNTTKEESTFPTQQSGNQGSTPDEEINNPNDSSVPTEESNNINDSSIPTKTDSKSLVVYFSWSGNTENVAKSVQSQTDSDIFEIVPAAPYSDDYDTVVDLAQEEQRNNTRPAISGSIENLEQYEVIYVGFPNWWGDMPMILYTFFDRGTSHWQRFIVRSRQCGQRMVERYRTCKDQEINYEIHKIRKFRP